MGVPDGERARVLELLKVHGDDTTSFQVLEPGMRYWWVGDDACVAYADTGGAWVAAGSPIAAPARADEVMERFAGAAARAGRRVRFFCLEDDVSARTRFDVLRVGEQPIWDPQAWPDTLRAVRSLREQLRRARAKGVAIRRLSAGELADPASPMRRRADALIARWLGRRAMAPMGFLVQIDPYSHPEERRFLAAVRGDDVVGVLVAVPVYAARGWFFEDVLRDPGAPNGTVELLFDAGMAMAREDGCRHVTWGLAPLASVSGWLGLVRDHTRWLYDFEGLRRFKAKLRPDEWHPVYLAHPRGERSAAAVLDALAAFARGSFVRFGVDTLIHRAPDVVRALAWLLVPWTALLALAPAGWFPSGWVKAAWIGYDAALFAGLSALARRWRRRLAAALAGAAVVDFAAGTAQLALHTAGRVGGTLAWAAVLAALAAPAFAAIFLWICRDRRPVDAGSGGSEAP